jgi:hypothetical protein
MRWPVSTACHWLRTRRSYRTVQDAVDELTGEDAADLLRRLVRGDADRRILVMLAVRGQESERAGDSAAMERYEAVLRAGRNVRFKIYPAELHFVHVPPEMAEEIEAALHQGEQP